MVQSEPRAVRAAGDKFDNVDEFLGIVTVQEKRVGHQSLMGQSAAAGLFPRQMFVINRNCKARLSEMLAAH